ncbi:hypothetical protein GIB67_039379 [Kingdonia uniflora]|uniref:Aminotransferase-like plant mobile domain-containing protein n=1 Tax=Kingdonia uniflora TaxID=39325 RepID=A0A7J7LXB9_9MAGN|nr:hypothetical protein GIB67_039379 [Kingdonia uniflora]
MRPHGTFTSVIKVWKDISIIPPVRDAMVSYEDAWSALSNVRQLLPNIDSIHIKSGNISISHLRMHLTIVADQEDDITISHTLMLFGMGHLWFQTANNTVLLGYHMAVANLDEAAQYDWGFAILASLYHGLDTAVTTGGAITGFSKLLVYWLYEYCGVGYPIVKEELKRGRDIQVVPLPPGGGTRMRQRGSGPQTRGEVLAVGRGVLEIILSRYRVYSNRNWDLAVKRIPRGVPFLISKPISSYPFTFLRFTLPSSIGNLFTLCYCTLLSTPQPQMSSLSSDSSITDPLGVSSSSSDDLIFDCAAEIYILHQATMTIVVHNATSSHGGSVMGRKDKRKKRDHPLGNYSIIQDYFKPNYTYEPWQFQ